MNNRGLTINELIILDYNKEYPAIYEEEKNNLLNLYKDKINKIDHIGSTSIINIKSKPIIDILIQTDNLDEFKKYTEENIADNTYTIKKEATRGGDYLIRKEEDNKVKALIHVYQTGDKRALDCLIFRDYLNIHEDEKKCYEALKIQLYNKYKNNRNEYTLGKSNYIKDIINKASTDEVY